VHGHAAHGVNAVAIRALRQRRRASHLLKSLTPIWVIPSRLLDILITKIEGTARSGAALTTEAGLARGTTRRRKHDEGRTCKRSGSAT
jgi:hypothetical protein